MPAKCCIALQGHGTGRPLPDFPGSNVNVLAFYGVALARTADAERPVAVLDTPILARSGM